MARPPPVPAILGQIIATLQRSPRPVDQIGAACLSIGAEFAARMQRHMIATAPDVLAQHPPIAHVEVITLDPSKLSHPRKP